MFYYFYSKCSNKTFHKIRCCQLQKYDVKYLHLTAKNNFYHTNFALLIIKILASGVNILDTFAKLLSPRATES